MVDYFDGNEQDQEEEEAQQGRNSILVKSSAGPVETPSTIKNGN
jgi:hypothetical protein